MDIIDRAYIFSARVHDGQMRLSGEPYLSHPLEVAGILADMKLDAVSIAAGLLHDVIEDTHATEEEIGDIFGHDVLHIVSGVTKLSKLPFNSAKAREAESIRKMLLAMADDIRVILIKLADRLHNMKTLQYPQGKQAAKKKKIAQETLDIYAPIAARLGIYWIKNDLEDTGLFSYINPKEYLAHQRPYPYGWTRIKKSGKNMSQRSSSYIQMQNGRVPPQSARSWGATNICTASIKKC